MKIYQKLLALGVLATVFTLTACSTSPNNNNNNNNNNTAISNEVEEEQEEDRVETAQVGYTTVTEVFDWGPAITKVVLDFGVDIDESSLSTDIFNVESVRRYKPFDFETFTEADEEEEFEVTREVTEVYLSDAEGNKVSDGEFVTLEMPVGPTMAESSVLTYNPAAGGNQYVETTYKISLVEGETLVSTDGYAVTMEETDKSNEVGAIQLLVDDFDHNQVFSYDDTDMMYATYAPENASEEEGSNPLIIWLHGGGEGGDDTNIILLANKVVSMATEEVQGYFGENGAHILVPQAPTRWMHYVEDNPGESIYTEALMALIDEYVEANPQIDTDRIYIGGCSNGGYMTVEMLVNYPEYFAAAYPICHGYSTEWMTDERIDAIKDIPMWIVHAMTDSTIPVVELGEDGIPTLDENGEAIMLDLFSNALYDRVVDAGATNVYYTLLENVEDTSGNYFMEDGVTPYEYSGHWSWVNVFNNECVEDIDGEDVTIFEWLGQQTK